MRPKSAQALYGTLIAYDTKEGKGLVKEDETGNEFYIEKEVIIHGSPHQGHCVIFEPCAERIAYCGVAIIVPSRPNKKIYLS